MLLHGDTFACIKVLVICVNAYIVRDGSPLHMLNSEHKLRV